MIPYSRQEINADDIAAVVSALQDDILTGGNKVAAFEQKIADYLGVKYCIAVSSGTAALHTAYAVAGISEGDEVITTPLSFVATSNAALYVGAIPKFVDINFDGNINVSKIEAAISDKTKAIVPVDYAGKPVDIRSIMQIAKKHNLVVIEDAAHAFGSKFDDTFVGQSADITTFSFHPVKPFTTLEGGALVTNDKDYYEQALRFRSHGIVKKNVWNMDMVELGYNYRLSDVACALGMSQLNKLEHFIEKRNEIAAFYDEYFEKNPYFISLKLSKSLRSSRHLYPIILDRSMWCPKEDIFEACKAAGIGVQVHYKPIYQNSYYVKKFGKMRLSTCEDFYLAVLALPCHQGMSLDDAKMLADTFLALLEPYKLGCKY
jgi:UDP-4-amino-4,6-dideoxy-L-N-acetyl-beta-L-altrosamine transaminase